MKRRERTAAILALPTPSLALRKWQRQPRAGEDGDYGEDVYASREEWRAARAAWAAEHGMTVMQWWVAVAEDAYARARSLGEMNAPYSFLPDEDEDDDPRACPVQHLTPEQQDAAAVAMLAKMEA